jgi:hypothetical protein
MAAPEGNEFWKLRSKHGPDVLFSDPVKLREACCEYFEWVEANPLFEDKIGFYEGDAIHTPAAKMRAMTIEGLCLYLGTITRTWRDWREKREDLLPVIEWAETVIRQQKFSGAAAGLLNPTIIARDLGLADKSELQNLDRNGQPTDPKGSAADALIDKIDMILMKAQGTDGGKV